MQKILSTPSIVQITDAELLASLCLRGHTLHGTLDEAVFILGTPLAFDISADPVAVDGWAPSPQQRASAGPSSAMGHDGCHLPVRAEELGWGLARDWGLAYVRAGHTLPLPLEQPARSFLSAWQLEHGKLPRTHPCDDKNGARRAPKRAR